MRERLKSDAQVVRFLQVLKRRSWLIAVIALVAAGAAYGFAKRKPNQYTATAALLFQNDQLDQQLFGNAVISSNVDPTRQAETNLALVELPSVARLVGRALHIAPSRVIREVSFGSDATSDVLTVTATDRSPVTAARIANTYVKDYIYFRASADQSQLAEAERTVKNQLAAIPPSQQGSSLAQSLQARSYELGLLASLQTGNAEVVQTALAPRSPSSPKPAVDAAIGLVLGLILAALLVFGLERYDRRVKTVEDVEELFETPVIGLIPESHALRSPGALGTPREQDAFRMVRTQLRYFDVDRTIRRVMVTSADSEEGKSTLALNLARAAAVGEDRRALLIETDMRRPSISAMIGADSLAGLSELLSHSQDLETALRELVVTPARSEEEGAHGIYDVLVAGAIPPNPLELLESRRMTELLELADATYDLIIVDTPPIGVVSDPISLVHQVDGVVLVSRLGRSRRDRAMRLRKQLRGLNAHILGVVVNGVRPEGGNYYDYAGYYSHRGNGRRPRRRSRLMAVRGR
jgi:succinoglycan biosynthesis transport protein ExoP